MTNYKVLAFIPLFALSACASRKEAFQATQIQPVRPVATDTVRVVGTHSIYVVPTYGMPLEYKYIHTVNKSGAEKDFRFDVFDEPVHNGSYVNRGDTIVMQGNRFVKNLTQERLKSEFVKSR